VHGNLKQKFKVHCLLVFRHNLYLVYSFLYFTLHIMFFSQKNKLHKLVLSFVCYLSFLQNRGASWQHLRSATRQILVVLRHQLSSYGRWAFCVAGPSVWDSLPDSLRDLIIGGNSFRQSLTTFLFTTYWCIQRIRGFTTMCYISRLLLTYLLRPNRGQIWS